MAWTSVYILFRDKQVKGLNIWETCLFACWGFWNLWYYPHLHQWASFLGGMFIVSANTTWFILALKYRHKNKTKEALCQL